MYSVTIWKHPLITFKLFLKSMTNFHKVPVARAHFEVDLRSENTLQKTLCRKKRNEIFRKYKYGGEVCIFKIARIPSFTSALKTHFLLFKDFSRQTKVTNDNNESINYTSCRFTTQTIKLSLTQFLFWSYEPSKKFMLSALPWISMFLFGLSIKGLAVNITIPHKMYVIIYIIAIYERYIIIYYQLYILFIFIFILYKILFIFIWW